MFEELYQRIKDEFPDASELEKDYGNYFSWINMIFPVFDLDFSICFYKDEFSVVISDVVGSHRKETFNSVESVIEFIKLKLNGTVFALNS